MATVTSAYFTSNNNGTVLNFGFDDNVYVAGSLGTGYSFVYNSIGTSLMMNEYTTTTPSNLLTFTFTDMTPSNDFLMASLYSYYTPIIDSSGNTFAGGAFIIGGEGDNNIDLSEGTMYYYGSDLMIFGNGGNDSITGSYGSDYIVAGKGADTVYQSEGSDGDTIDFSETTSLTDTYVVNKWGSLDDMIIGFDVSGTTTNDCLNMFSNAILSNTTANVDGIDSGTITQHSVAGGIVTLKDSTGAEIIINQSNADVAITYMQNNLTVGNVGAVNVDSNGDGVNDSLVVFGNAGNNTAGVFLEGVSGVTLGTAAGTNVIQIVDTSAPEAIGGATTSNGVKIMFSETLAAVNATGWSLQKNGATDMGTASVTKSGNTVTLSTSTALLATDYVLARPTDPTTNVATDANGNSSMWIDPEHYAFAIGGSGNNVINLSSLPVTLMGFDASGNAGNDTITGSRYGDYLDGGIGDDILNGGAGDDELDGGDGNDILNGGTGYDSMYGGKGDDTYVIDGMYHGDQVYENYNEGTDTIQSYVSYAILGDNVENLQIKTGIASNAYGNTLNNVITSGAGNNIMDGGDGRDTVSYVLSKGGVTVSLGLTTAQNTIGSGYDTISNFENLTGSNYADTLSGDIVANTLIGNGGNDNIYGGGGIDVLLGGAGNDILNGGLGSDKLTGGVGNDFFVFNTALGANNIDTIADFSAPADTIRLENSIFTKLTSTGTLNAANFVANTTGKAVDANDYIIYETDTGKLFYDADGSGAGAAVQFALLGVTTHPTNVTAADFVVI